MGFFKEHPQYNKNVFLMTKFDDNNSFLNDTIKELQDICLEHDLELLKANNKTFIDEGYV